MIWFNRILLAVSVVLFTSIAVRNISDPVGAEAPHHITLGSPEALTNTRVAGGLFLSLALLLLGAAVSKQRHVWGLWLLATVAVTLTAIRLLGLALDGPAEFTLFVLKPEIALSLASSAALVVALRRQRETATTARR
jgi:hypothetical protein